MKNITEDVPPPAPICVVGDVYRVEHVISNNVIKFSPLDGVIQVKVSNGASPTLRRAESLYATQDRAYYLKETRQNSSMSSGFDPTSSNKERDRALDWRSANRSSLFMAGQWEWNRKKGGEVYSIRHFQ